MPFRRTDVNPVPMRDSDFGNPVSGSEKGRGPPYCCPLTRGGKPRVRVCKPVRFGRPVPPRPPSPEPVSKGSCISCSLP